MVVSTIGIQPIWTARLLDRQSKATVDDIKVVNKIHDRAHHDQFPLITAAGKLFPHILANVRTQREVIAFDKSLVAFNCSARPDISRCMIFLLLRETKSTASSGPVSRRISARSFRMKKLCDAVSKRMKTTCYYPACIPLICSLHTLSNQLFELRSHWRSGLHCRTVTIYIIWFATNSFHFGQADLKIHHLVCRQFVPLWPSGLEDTSSGLPPIRSTQKMRKRKKGVDWIRQAQRCTSDFHPCPNRWRSGHDTKSGQRDSSLNSRKSLPVASSFRVSNVRASSVTIMVVSTIGIQPIWTARLLDRQSKATVDDIKVVNKIHDRAHHDQFPLITAARKLFPHILANARTQREVIAFDKSLVAFNCSARPDISRCMIFLLLRETKSTALSGPVSRRISARSFRMKKLCDAVSKRMKTTCDYPACIPLICSLHTLSNQLFELRSHWRSGLHCRTVTMVMLSSSGPEHKMVMTNSVMTTRCRLFHVHEQQGVSQSLSNNRTVRSMPNTDKTRD
ncbi:hypothetical protein T01_11326 [Trichinella spiralis]|uniref:Uncharacterized protein n=1 Tax=Trichinella spiralis TaxID=6334 RepID=A0A0V1B8Y0_TRISP|nr:hypothetical protein T01_11326 [Trichinella spiralis]